MSSSNFDTGNTLFQLAADLVNQSGRSLFLTGKAGTGKTTFLKYIRGNCHKQMAVVAPTGVAAVNAGGATIHSFFQLPLSPFVPGTLSGTGHEKDALTPHHLISRLRINSEKIKVIRQLELLIIDEISMVRCDILDAIDTVLRHVRRRPSEKFGGVQVLLIGDMFQLPPVVRDAEWKLLSGFYDSPYFFSSLVLKDDPPVCIELEKIYRQKDEKFIGLLNQVRHNELNKEGQDILDSRFLPSFQSTGDDGYIILTTHNETARSINARELGKLDGEVFMFKAEIEHEFPENAYPADETFYVKTGARVMFIRNDSDSSKRYFNGKIGTVIRVADDKIVVQCKDENDEIEVSRESWENIHYSVNKATRQMEAKVLGAFTQYPLRLAWAITIHKSQGLTFERAVIDAGNAFAPGQVYVALSRCTSLDGLVLKTPIRQRSLLTDTRIVEFSRMNSSREKLQEQLKTARKEYFEKTLIATFDFRDIVDRGYEWSRYIQNNESAFDAGTGQWVKSFLGGIDLLQSTAEKFHRWLNDQFRLAIPPQENIPLQERTARAASHFTGQLDPMLASLRQTPIITDSRLHAAEVNEAIREIFGELAVKRYFIQGISSSMDVDVWQRIKTKFVMPPFSINVYAGAGQQKTESPHPALYQRLREQRDAICAARQLPIYLVAGSKTIDEMARYLPQTPAELKKISGFGEVKIEQYGQQFLEIILEYCSKNHLSSLIYEKPLKKQSNPTRVPKQSKPDTRAESFRLYNEGKRVHEIATERNLAIQTIEGHLAHYVSSGVIPIEGLVSPEKIKAVEEAGLGTLTELKKKLDTDMTYGEIRLALAWLSFQRQAADDGQQLP